MFREGLKVGCGDWRHVCGVREAMSEASILMFSISRQFVRFWLSIIYKCASHYRDELDVVVRDMFQPRADCSLVVDVTCIPRLLSDLIYWEPPLVFMYEKEKACLEKSSRGV